MQVLILEKALRSVKAQYDANMYKFLEEGSMLSADECPDRSEELAAFAEDPAALLLYYHTITREGDGLPISRAP